MYIMEKNLIKLADIRCDMQCAGEQSALFDSHSLLCVYKAGVFAIVLC